MFLDGIAWQTVLGVRGSVKKDPRISHSSPQAMLAVPSEMRDGKRVSTDRGDPPSTALRGSSMSSGGTRTPCSALCSSPYTYPSLPDPSSNSPGDLSCSQPGGLWQWGHQCPSPTGTLVGAAADPKVLWCQRWDLLSGFLELTAFLLHSTWAGSTWKS